MRTGAIELTPFLLAVGLLRKLIYMVKGVLVVSYFWPQDGAACE
jgi:hypothetical protein